MVLVGGFCCWGGVSEHAHTYPHIYIDNIIRNSNEMRGQIGSEM